MAPASLTLLDRAAVLVGALTAEGLGERLRDEARALAAAGVAAADLREAAFIAALFAGFPKGVAALAALADIPPVGAIHRDAAAALRHELRTRGETLFRDLHRARSGRQIEMLEQLHPDLADTVLAEVYGRVIARPFLPLRTREMVGVGALLAQGPGPQLRAHLLAAFNLGVSTGELEEALALAARLVGRDLREARVELDRLASPTPPADAGSLDSPESA